MATELAKVFKKYTDELFKAESKTELLTNSDFDWSGAHSVLIYKISTVALNDYARNRSATDLSGENNAIESISRYGLLADLDATTEEMILKKDRSFIFNVDKLDEDETAKQLQAASALARELREVVVPEVDSYVYKTMVDNAGTKAAAVALTKSNIYQAILAGSQALDDAEVPDTQRVLILTPAAYTLLKQAVEFDNTDIGAEMRMLGVVAMLDGMAVVKVPSSRLPEKFGFMIAHPAATVAPVKLESYGIHKDTPLSSGSIVTGRVCYDAFVLDNKKTGIYYQATT